MTNLKLHSNQYHSEKAKIVQPIDDFMRILDERTSKEVEFSVALNQMYLVILLTFTAVDFVFFVILFYVNRQKISNMYVFKDALLNFFK